MEVNTMKTQTTIILGNADTCTNIQFRKKGFLTESNREHIEECVHAFISLPIPIAFQNLVKMTCWPKKNIPKELWENIHLDPSLIPDKAWNSFVNELRYQYKITHPHFMTEFYIPDECMAAYDGLVSHASEVAAYMFYKKISTFLYDHIEHTIGQDHISATFNLLHWHSRDTDVNKSQQIKGLLRLSLKEYEAIYFHDHMEQCIALFQSLWDYMEADEQPSAMGPAEIPILDDADLPFFFGDPTNTEVTEPAEQSFLELSKENILEYETDFYNFVVNNDEDSLNRLQTAGFDTNQLRFKSVAIFRVLRAHRDMLEAVEALSK